MVSAMMGPSLLFQDTFIIMKSLPLFRTYLAAHLPTLHDVVSYLIFPDMMDNCSSGFVYRMLPNWTAK